MVSSSSRVRSKRAAKVADDVHDAPPWKGLRGPWGRAILVPPDAYDAPFAGETKGKHSQKGGAYLGMRAVSDGFPEDGSVG